VVDNGLMVVRQWYVGGSMVVHRWSGAYECLRVFVP